MVRKKTRKESAVIKQHEDQAGELADSVINTVREPLVALDQDLKVVKVNRSFYETFKVKPEETLGQHIYELGNKQLDIPKLRNLLENVLPQTPTYDDYEIEYDFPDIGWRTMLLNARQIPGVLGKEQVTLLAIEDITVRRQDEKALTEKTDKTLRESKEIYRSLVENINDVLLALDSQGNITYISPVVERLSKYTVSNLIGKPFSQLIYPDDLPALLDRFTRLLSGQLEPWEFRVVDKDGRFIFVRASSRPLLEDGQVVGITTLITDITDRKKIEEELRESELRYHELVNNSKNGVAIYEAAADGEDFIFKDFNRAAESIDNIKKEDIIGKGILQIFPGIKEFGLFEVLQSVWRTGVPERHPSTQYHDERISGWRDNYVYRLPSGKIVVIYNDVTESKQAEEALLKSNNLLDRTIDQSPIAMWISDEKGTLIRINRACCELLNITEKEVLGKYNIFQDNIVEKHGFMPQVKSVFEEGKTVRFEIRYDTAELESLQLEGRAFVILDISIFPIIDTDGHIINAMIHQADITARKKSEESLRSEQLMLARTEGIANIGSWEWDIATDTVTWSDELFRIFQRDPQAGAPNFAEHPAFYHPDDMARLRQAVEAAVADGTPYELELRAIRKDGETRVCVARGVAEMSQGGRPVHLVGSLQDITERRLSNEKLLKSYESLKKTLNDAINTMVKIMETRDPYTAGHQQSVADLAIAIAREMKLEDTRIDQIRMAAVIHDIGKLYIPSDILSKPGRLSEIEFSLIKTHAQSGYDIVKGMDFPCNVAKTILQHHERLDGSGYPNQLKGEDTLLEAKILAVADVIEAMSSHRPYRPALGIDKALEEISKNKGRLYDPDVVDTSLKLFSSGKFEFKSI